MATIRGMIDDVDIEIYDDGVISLYPTDREGRIELIQNEIRALYLFFHRPDVVERLREAVFSHANEE
jgi:hypothetical protein